MATFQTRRRITRGWIPALCLAGTGAAFYGVVYGYQLLHPAAHLTLLAPNSEQIGRMNERDARYSRLHSEMKRLDAQIAATRPALETAEATLHAEEKSLQDVQAHIASERQMLNTTDPKSRAAFNALVQDFNRRRAALLNRDNTLARQVADLNDAITRRNQLAKALDAMRKAR